MTLLYFRISKAPMISLPLYEKYEFSMFSTSNGFYDFTPYYMNSSMFSLPNDFYDILLLKIIKFL